MSRAGIGFPKRGEEYVSAHFRAYNEISGSAAQPGSAQPSSGSSAGRKVREAAKPLTGSSEPSGIFIFYLE